MALFPKEQELANEALKDAPSRMRWTRERGTRRLLTGLIGLAVIWIVVGRIQDHFLLSKSWPALHSDVRGLTVVGALNPRTDYDRNMFKILTENSTSRVVLTEYGWNTIFDPRNGEMYDDAVSSAITSAMRVDSLAGYAMLEPFLRASVAYQMGDRSAYKSVTRATQLVVPKESDKVPERHTTLGELIDRFSGNGAAGDSEQSNDSEGGSNSGRSVEQVITLSAQTVVDAMPVVLTGDDFTDGWLEEQPANLLAGTAYTAHLGLTAEGRSRFYQWSHDHSGESLVFVLNNNISVAARIASPLDVNEWGVTNIKDRDAAQALVDYVNHHAGHH